MEIVNIDRLEEYKSKKSVKKVPILSEQVMADVLYIAPNANDLSIEDMRSDWIYYVVKGKGKLVIDNDSIVITPGMLILMAKGERHVFSTTGEHLSLLSFRSVQIQKSEFLRRY